MSEKGLESCSGNNVDYPGIPAFNESGTPAISKIFEVRLLKASVKKSVLASRHVNTDDTLRTIIGLKDLHSGSSRVGQCSY